MSNGLPERASLEYLKKLAKDRLRVRRQTDPSASLADAQYEVAREHGFASWRALKAEIERRRAPAIAAFFRACANGDVAALRAALSDDGSLVRERTSEGRTGLHIAVAHVDAVRVLLESGADPDARDDSDNVAALDVAAAQGRLETVRALLDAGADVHGAGDLHHGDVIGWASRRGNEAVIDLLLARGARHHIFSAMALGDRGLVERLVDERPASLSRRRSRFENSQTPVHAAFAPPDGLGHLAGAPDYAMLALLIDLGADVDATDDKGRTPLDVALLRGDREAARLLVAAGARQPPPTAAEAAVPPSSVAVRSVRKSMAMFSVADVRATLRWYEALGFRVDDRYEEDGEVMFAKLSLGEGELAFGPGGPVPPGVSLWFYSDRVRDVYDAVRSLQLRAARAAMTGASEELPEVRFDEDLYRPFYGGWQFSIRDINGLSLIFYQPDWLTPR